jgi:hypothetical protein
VGTPVTLLKLPLGTWFGKPRCLTLSLPGKAGLTAHQLNEWMAYNAIEPFGEYRSELRHGQAMSLTANLNRDTKERWEPFKAVEFMNFIEPVPEKKLSIKEIEAHFDKIFG